MNATLPEVIEQGKIKISVQYKCKDKRRVRTLILPSVTAKEVSDKNLLRLNLEHAQNFDNQYYMAKGAFLNKMFWVVNLLGHTGSDEPLVDRFVQTHKLLQKMKLQ